MKKAFSISNSGILLMVCVLWPTGSSSDIILPSNKPSLLVSFERQTIRESDNFLIEIILTNGESKELKDVVLQITSPDFLSWHEKPENNAALKLLDQNKLVIGNIAGNSLVRKSFKVKSNPIIQVGSFNLLFTVEFVRDNKKELIAVEKLIQANLFGSDTIAGVPLALAGFIVPGLFFWVITSLFRLPWSIG
jgi:hypothetical protein